MGEARRDALRVSFARAIKLEFHGARVISDAERLSVNPVMGHIVYGRGPAPSSRNPLDLVDFRPAPRDNRDPLGAVPGPPE